MLQSLKVRLLAAVFVAVIATTVGSQFMPEGTLFGNGVALAGDCNNSDCGGG